MLLEPSKLVSTYLLAQSSTWRIALFTSRNFAWPTVEPRSNWAFVSLLQPFQLGKISLVSTPSIDQIAGQALAEAGFFYLGLNDCVQCPVCDLLQSSWAPGDDPWIRHAANSPACAFLVEEKGSDWIRDVYNEHCES